MNINKLADLIDGKTFTKAQVIREAGISRPALDSILEGRDFKVSNLEKLARALGKPVGYFFADERTEVRTVGRDYAEHDNIEHKGTKYVGRGAMEEGLREQIAILKSQLADKERIIRLMEERR